MKQFILLLAILCSVQFTVAQNVGVGTNNPQSLLHILDGHLRLEGDNKFFDMHTSATATSGMRFYTDGIFKGNWFYNGITQKLNLSNNGNVKGLIFDLNNNKVFLGRDIAIHPSEKFGIRTPVAGPNFGGMYNETTGNAGGKPFYGYAIDGLIKGYHYFDGGDNTWKLNVAGDKLFVKNTGQIGIGIADPLDELHVDANIRVEGVTPLLKFYQGTTYASYLQQFNNDFQISNIENGNIFFKTNNTTRMAINGIGNVGIGNTLPGDKFHLTGTMRLESTNPLMKFYQGGAYTAYLQQFGNDFNISNIESGKLILKTANSTRMTIDAAGKVGIGTTAPLDILHLTGDIRMDNTNPMLKFYQGGTFSTFIQQFNDDLFISNLENGKVFLRTNNLDRVTISEAGNVGIGTTAPIYSVDLNSSTARGIDLLNTYSGTSAKYGIRSDADENGTGTRYGTYSRATAHAGDASSTFGVYGIANGTDSPSSLFGVYGVVTAAGTGPKYALYGNATTAANSWALYANGNAHFNNDVRIGHTDIVAGYKLSVDGKIISEEVKVQLSQNWPDYVFDEQYDLMPLDEVNEFIKKENHLPGVPSAKQIEEEDGFHVGEMNRILLEKVEELTLYILKQQDRLESQDERIKQLETGLSNDRK